MAETKGGGQRRKPSIGVREVGTIVSEQLPDLIKHEVEGVISVQSADDGWTVLVQALELERIPQTTDVLAAYEVQLSDDGTITSYRRLRRYTRAQVGEDGQ